MGRPSSGKLLKVNSHGNCGKLGKLKPVPVQKGGEKYQQAFYVFEEMAQTASTSAPKSLIGQAVAELHLGRLPEAEAALQQALEKEPQNTEAIANSIVLNVLSGKDTADLTK